MARRTSSSCMAMGFNFALRNHTQSRPRRRHLGFILGVETQPSALSSYRKDLRARFLFIELRSLLCVWPGPLMPSIPRILIVDDNIDHRLILIYQLARIGTFAIGEAADGQQALAVIATDPPD